MRSEARLRLKPADHRRKSLAAGKDRTRSELRTVLITVAVTLLVAGISSWTTLAVTRTNVTSADMQAEEEFRRNQQQVAFSDFIAASHTLLEEEASSVSQPHSKEFEPSPEWRDRIRDASDSIIHNLALVRLVASDDTFAAALALVNKWKSIRAAVSQYRVGLTIGGRDFDPGYQQQIKIRDSFVEMDKLIDDFVEAGRKDLNV